MVLVIVAGISLMLWAGIHNMRERRLAVEKAQQNRIELIPVKPGETSGTSGGSSGEDAPPQMRGKAAPGFTLVSLEGKKVSLADFKGRPVLVNFWATWCAPCKLEMPWFEEFRSKYAGQGFEVLGIAEDEAGKDEIAKAAKKLGATYPILLTDGKVAPAYGGIDFLPMSFYVDRRGVIVEQTAGLATKDEVEANIKKVIGAERAAAGAQ
jgi:thiol-disulfide isomerase/thioredoxin